MIFSLASAIAGTDDATVWVNEVNGVTEGGTKCSTFGECYDLVQAGEDIDYDGASGPLEFTDAGEPSTGVYDVFEYDSEGNPVTIEPGRGLETPLPVRTRRGPARPGPFSFWILVWLLGAPERPQIQVDDLRVV